VKSRAAQTWIAGNSENEPDRQHGRDAANDEKIQIARGAEITGKDGVLECPIDHRLPGTRNAVFAAKPINLKLKRRNP